MSSIKRLSVNERKKEIMNSAIKVILDKGLLRATMGDVIAGTSLSKGGVYHYYGSIIEIFKDIMILGIEYRNKIIVEHLKENKEGLTNEFIAKQMVEKILDDNIYMPLYVEFLIAKKRDPKLKNLMFELQEKTIENFNSKINNLPKWMIDENIFQFISEFMNSIMVAANILDSREVFKKNRKILEDMFLLILNNM